MSRWFPIVRAALLGVLALVAAPALSQTWTEIPGGGTTNLPVAATTFGDKIYLFAIGGQDHAHYINSFDGTSWAGWVRHPSGGTTATADTTTVFRDKLYLFAIGGNDHKHYVNSFDGSSWAGWSEVPGGGTTLQRDAAAVLRDKLYLFAVGANDHHHYMNAFDGTSWTGWELVPGGGTTTIAQTAATDSNRLYLFAVGTGDHKHYVNAFDGMAWTGWSELPGGSTTDLAQAAAAGGNRLYLFAVGTNDHRHYLNTLEAGTWDGWRLVSPGATTALPQAAAYFRNHMYLFAVGMNDHRHYMLPIGCSTCGLGGTKGTSGTEGNTPGVRVAHVSAIFGGNAAFVGQVQAKEGQPIYDGDHFYTGPGTKMEVTLDDDGTTILLDANTDPSVLKKAQCFWIRLTSGTMTVINHRETCVDANGAKFTQHSNVLYGAYGGRVTVAVFNGSVTMNQPPGYTINAGQILILQNGNPVGQPQPMSQDMINRLQAWIPRVIL
jgi:hypothetical protein